MSHKGKNGANGNNLQGNGERILLVEDESSILEWLETFLTIHGYTVLCAPDAAKAPALFEQEQGDFGLLFTDVTLPGISGVELAEKISSLRRKMPILLGSGYVIEESVSS